PEKFAAATAAATINKRAWPARGLRAPSAARVDRSARMITARAARRRARGAAPETCATRAPKTPPAAPRGRPALPAPQENIATAAAARDATRCPAPTAV